MIVAIQPAVLDIDATAKYLSLSVSTVEALVRGGDFPRPRQLSGRRVGWLVSELDAWLAARPISEQPPPVNCQLGRPPGKKSAPQAA